MRQRSPGDGHRIQARAGRGIAGCGIALAAPLFSESPKGTQMPLYEYQCRQCSERTEVVRKFSDPPLTTCESCGGELAKLISSPAIQFKGSGFYITDYARAGGANGKKASSDGSSAGDSGRESATGASASEKSESKSESKTESKSETKSEPKAAAGSPKSSD